MFKFEDLPKTCLCQRCKREVSKHQLSEIGLKYNKLICVYSENNLAVDLKKEIAPGITVGDAIVMKFIKMLDDLGIK